MGPKKTKKVKLGAETGTEAATIGPEAATIGPESDLHHNKATAAKATAAKTRADRLADEAAAEAAEEQQRQAAEEQQRQAAADRQATSTATADPPPMKRQNALDINIERAINDIIVIGDELRERNQFTQVMLEELQTKINAIRKRTKIYIEKGGVQFINQQNLFIIKELQKLLDAKIMEFTVNNPDVNPAVNPAINPALRSTLFEVAEMLKRQLGIMGGIFNSVIYPQSRPPSGPLPLQQLIQTLIIEIDAEINKYNPPPSDQVRADQVRAILFYRFFKILSDDREREQMGITQEQIVLWELDLNIVKFIFNMIDLYRGDPDRPDIIREGMDYHKFVYYIARNIRPDWWANFDVNRELFVREFIDTGLGKTQADLAAQEDEEDRVIMSKDKLYSILFSNFIYSNLAALVFPFWPIKATTPIPVFVGTGPIGSDANCINFQINEIHGGSIGNFNVLAPITSSSNDEALAVRKFLKPGGVILKIILQPGSSYMCVSEKGSDEQETFVLPGKYNYVSKLEQDMVGQLFYEYEFNQIETIEVNPAVIADLWSKAKEAVNSYAIASLEPYKGIEAERSSMARQTTYDILKELFNKKNPIVESDLGGGSKRRTNKRRTNKRRTKRRKTKNRRTNKRNSKRRKTKRRRTNNKRKSRKSRRSRRI
jgi:hypothetical protein